jgi:hypothetical protein
MIQHMARPLFYSVALAAASMVTATSLSAQVSVTIPRPTTQYDSATIRAIRAKADTGRMMPGYQNMAVYNTPSYCLSAIRRVDFLFWRTQNRDTIEVGSPGDTTTTRAREIGRACVKNLSLESTPRAELDSYMKIAVELSDTALLRAVVDKQVATAPDNRARALALFHAGKALLQAHPQRLDLANTYIKKLLDQSTKEAQEISLYLVGFLLYDAYTKFDTTEMLRLMNVRQNIAMMMAKSDSNENQAKINAKLNDIYMDSIPIVAYKGGPNWKEEVERLIMLGISNRGPESGAMTYEGNMNAWVRYVGEPVSKLTGQWWYPAPIDLDSMRGKVVLILQSGAVGDMRALSNLMMLRRLYEKYKDRGFHVVLIAKTQGYSLESPPLEPADEARTIGWYINEFQRHPFTVVVQETPYRRIADGRRVNGDISFHRMFRGGRPSAVLIGPDGTIQTMLMNITGRKGFLEKWIERVMERAK